MMKNLCIRALYLFVCFILSQGDLTAVWQPSEVISGATDVSDVGGPVLAVTPSGNALAVWSYGEPSPVFPIASSFYTRGAGWSSPQQISDPNPDFSFQGDPDVAMNSSNYGVAVWEAYYGPIDSGIVVGAVKQPNGVWGPVQFISDATNPNLDAANINVALNESGLAVAAWRSEDNGADPVVDMINTSFLVNGTWTPPFILSSNERALGTNIDIKPQLKINEKGDVAVVWFRGFEPNLFGIVAATYNATTATWSAPVTLDGPSNNQFSGNPGIGIDSNGNALAIWTNGDIITNQESLYTSYFTYGVGWGAKELLDISVGINADLAMDPAGNATAVWVNSSGIVLSAFRPFGGVWSAPVTISTGTGNTFDNEFMSQEPIAVDAAGNVMAIWLNSAGDLVSAYKIFNQPWQAPELVFTGSVTYQSVGIAACGFAVTLWEENLEDGSDQVRAAINENFLAPFNATITKGCKERFATQSVRIFNFSWSIPSECILFYNIYCDGALFKVIPGGEGPSSISMPLKCNCKNFTITSVNLFGFESDPILFQ